MTINEAIDHVEALLDYELNNTRIDSDTLEAIEVLVEATIRYIPSEFMETNYEL